MENNIKQIVEQKVKEINFLIDKQYINKFFDIGNDFIQMINDIFFILEDLSKNVPELKDNVNQIIKKYNNTFTDHKYSGVSQKKFQSQDDQIDYLNFFSIYLKNVYKFDLATAMKMPEKSQNIITNSNLVGNNQVNNGEIPFGFNPNAIINPVVFQQVKRNFKRRFQNDDPFFYHSKPKHIPICAIAFSCLGLLFTLSLICLSIFAFILNGKLIYVNDQAPHNMVMTGIFLIFFALLAFQLSWVLLSPYFIARREHRKISNNERYNISIWTLRILMVAAILMIIFLLFPFNSPNNVFKMIMNQKDELVDESYSYIFAWMIILSIMIFFYVLIFILGLVLMVTRPKKNDEMYQKVYYEEIAKVAMPGSMPDKPISDTPSDNAKQ